MANVADGERERAQGGAKWLWCSSMKLWVAFIGTTRKKRVGSQSSVACHEKAVGEGALNYIRKEKEGHGWVRMRGDHSGIREGSIVEP